MNDQVLARKWRPKTFPEVIGQEHVRLALENALYLKKIHHAYIFSGTRGVGKTTIARILAKSFNCEMGMKAIPCSKCMNCSDIEKGRCIDLIEIDAASKTKVEDTRDILDNMQYTPVRSRFKVYLIDEVHMLSRHSFNALLKVLEEPPNHVKFLLATTEPQKLPMTILSRCLQFHLKTLDVEQISNHLKNVLQVERINSDVRALPLLARAAFGSMRDALSLTDQAIVMGQGKIKTYMVRKMLGMVSDEQHLAILEALIKEDCTTVLYHINQANSIWIDWEIFLVEILALLHRISMMQFLPSLSDNHYIIVEQQLRELARIILPTDVQIYYKIILEGRKELLYTPNKRMGVEMTLLRAINKNYMENFSMKKWE